MISAIENNRLLKLNTFDITEWLFYLYIFSLVFISGMAVGNLISKTIGYILIGYFFIFDIIIYKKKIIYFEEFVFILIWVIICLISGLQVKDQQLYIGRLATIFQLVVFYIISYSIIVNHQIKVKRLFLVIIFSTILIFIQGIWMRSGVSILLRDSRLYSAQGNPNTLANFGIFSFLFVTYFVFTVKNIWYKILFILIDGFLLYGLLETESRKAMVVIPFIICFFFILHSVHQYREAQSKLRFIVRTCIILSLLLLIMFGIYQFFIYSGYFRRFNKLLMFVQMQSGRNEQAFKTIIDYSTYERRQFLKYGLQMWLDHFWIGRGLDNFKTCINEYWLVSKHVYAHNNYVEMLSTTGVLGFISYYMIYLIIFKKLFIALMNNNLEQRKLILVHTLLISMIVILVIEMVIVSYYLKFIWLILLLASSYTRQLLIESSNAPDYA